MDIVVVSTQYVRSRQHAYFKTSQVTTEGILPPRGRIRPVTIQHVPQPTPQTTGIFQNPTSELTLAMATTSGEPSL